MEIYAIIMEIQKLGNTETVGVRESFSGVLQKTTLSEV